MSSFRYLLAILLIFCLVNPGMATATDGSQSSRQTHSRSKKHKKSRHIYAHKSRHNRSTTPRKRDVESSGLQVPSLIQGKDQLSYVLNRIIAASDDGSADIGVYVKSLSSGETLFVRNIHQTFTPASIMKILTAEAALIYLGPNYRFATQLLTDAKGVKDGVLQGNLYIVLSGDPSLTYPDLVDLLTNLQNQGISAISGNVYIDNTAYDQRFYGPGWSAEDKNYYYGAPISASIINHNVLPLSMQPSSSGHKAKVIMSPVHFYPGINNSVVTRAGRHGCSPHMSTNANSSISLDGCLSKNSGWGITYVVTDIPEYNRTLFKSVLRRLGVDVYGNVTFGSAHKHLSLIAMHQSDPLPDLIHDMLKKSDNVIAGAIFKKLGQLYSNKPGSWENGSVAVSRILSQHAGVQTSGLRLLDGSGLSLDNLATPSQFMQVLQYAYSNKTSEYFISALPVAGVDGTLKRRMTNISRKIRAKTGTIAGSGIVSLAGYASSYYKQPIAFVIIINGHRGLGWRYKGMEDKIATALTRYTES